MLEPVSWALLRRKGDDAARELGEWCHARGRPSVAGVAAGAQRAARVPAGRATWSRPMVCGILSRVVVEGQTGQLLRWLGGVAAGKYMASGME